MTRFISGVVFALGVMIIALGLWQLQENPAAANAWQSWLILLMGVVGIAVARVVSALPPESNIVARAALKLKHWLGVEEWQLACLFLSPVLALAAARAAGSEAFMAQPWLAVFGWVGGAALALLGGWQFSRTRSGLSWTVVVLFLAFCASAFLIRAINTTHIPNVLTGDEGSSGLSAMAFVNGSTNNIFRVGWFSFPSLFFFIQSLTIRLLGNTIPALRLLAAFAGALTVGCVYLIGRRVFGNWTGIFAAIFLLAYNFHNHFSRIGLNNIWDGLWFLLVLGLFLIGWREDNKRSFLLAGLCLGLSQYFYVTARTLIGIPLIFLAIALLFDRGRLKRNLPGVVLMYLVFAVVFLPLAIFFLKNPDEYVAPLNRVSLMGEWLAYTMEQTGLPAWQLILRQVGLSFQAFFVIPIQMWYRPETPLLRPIPATFFIVGLIALLLKIKDARTWLLLIWLLTFAVIGGFSESTPAAQRYVAVAPALALTIGYGMQESAEFIARLWPGLRRRAEWLLLIIVLLIGVSELHFYYFQFTPRSDWGLNNQVAQRLADYLQDRDARWQVIFFGAPRMGYYSFSSLPYLNPEIQGVDYLFPWGAPENPPIVSDHLIFVGLPEKAEELERIKQTYPGGRVILEETQAGQMLYWLYETPE